MNETRLFSGARDQRKSSEIQSTSQTYIANFVNHVLPFTVQKYNFLLLMDGNILFSRVMISVILICLLVAGADPDRSPPFYGNQSTSCPCV